MEKLQVFNKASLPSYGIMIERIKLSTCDQLKSKIKNINKIIQNIDDDSFKEVFTSYERQSAVKAYLEIKEGCEYVISSRIPHNKDLY